MTETRKHCRSERSCEPETLAEALYCTIHHSGVSTAALADQLGVRRGYLLDAANPDREDVQFQARLLVPLILATGNFVALDLVEHQVRRVASTLPDPDRQASATDDLFEHAARVLNDTNAIIQEARKVVADRVITPEEVRAVRGHVIALHGAIAAFEAWIGGHALSVVPRPARAVGR